MGKTQNPFISEQGLTTPIAVAALREDLVNSNQVSCMESGRVWRRGAAGRAYPRGVEGGSRRGVTRASRPSSSLYLSS